MTKLLQSIAELSYMLMFIGFGMILNLLLSGERGLTLSFWIALILLLTGDIGYAYTRKKIKLKHKE